MKLLIFLSIISLGVFAEDKTHTVKESFLKEQKTFNGFAVGSHFERLAVESKYWTSWEIEKIVENGAKVTKGDVIVQFKAESLKNTIAKSERELAVHKKNLILQRKKLADLQVKSKKELHLASIKNDVARKSLEMYEDTGRAQFLKNLKNDISDMEKNLKYQQAELSQLEKMYKEDSLAEESEEIVLERQRDTVARAKRYVEIRERTLEGTMALKLPLSDFNKEYAAIQAKSAYENAKLQWDASLLSENNKMILAEKAYEKSVKRHENLKTAVESLNIKAPANGVCYIGDFNAGKWSTSFPKELKVGDKVSSGKPFITFVGEHIDRVQLKVSLLDHKFFAPNVSYILKHKGLQFDAKVVGELSKPIVGFSIVNLSVDNSLLSFTQKATISATITSSEKSVRVPVKAIRYRDAMPTEAYVVVKADDKKEDRIVSLGKIYGDNVIVSDGLKSGDVVVLP
ncbi:MAG: hypothetical protein NE334_19750 [Lentisphaeraceae bacterium]|nr:hypothetical protein [Lentisphaeraceae bacterium]